jgi:hypothetical protein
MDRNKVYDESPAAGVLFHYTTSSGLQGILDSKKLWMTSIRFLNDSSEFNYFFDKILENFESKKTSLSPDTLARAKYLLDHIKTSNIPTNVFTTSFSSIGDSLSQWRGYAESQGFSIMFDFTELCETLDKNSADYPIKMIKVDYCKGNAENEAERLVNELIESAKETQQIDSAFGMIVEEICYYSCKFKDENFSSEDEWRLVSIGGFLHKSNPVRLRDRNGELTPYIEISLTKDEISTIKEIKVGPGRNKEIKNLQKDALQLFKSSNKSYNFEVTTSDIPFRSF